MDEAGTKPYKVVKLNTLAFPKGTLPKCELTGVPAQVAFVTPHVTLYYATREHALDAWHGIMHKIGPLLGPLRTESAAVGTEEERAKRAYTMELSKKALVDVCSQEASKFLVQQRYALAVPGALVALKFLKEIFGNGAVVETIRPYSQLAEANLGLGRFTKAQEFLTIAQQIIAKNPDCSNNVRSQLHRNLGKLHFANGNLEDALIELSHDIYCSALDSGPEHVDAAPGYFHAASVFYAQHKIENALAFYDKVVDVWFRFLVAARQSDDDQFAVQPSVLTEAQHMLAHILAIRMKLLGDNHIASGEAKYTLGLLLLFAAASSSAPPASSSEEEADLQESSSLPGASQEARHHIESAFAIYVEHLGPDHPSAVDIKQVLDCLPTVLLDRTDNEALLHEQGTVGQIVSIIGDDDSNAVVHQAAFDGVPGAFPREMPPAARQSPIPDVPPEAQT